MNVTALNDVVVDRLVAARAKPLQVVAPIDAVKEHGRSCQHCRAAAALGLSISHLCPVGRGLARRACVVLRARRAS